MPSSAAAAATISASPSVVRSSLKRPAIEPAGIVEFFVEHRLAGQPARGKAQNDEMALDAPLRVARDHFAVAGQRNGSMASAVSSRTSRLTASSRRLAGLDDAAGQRVETERRFARAPHDQHLAVAE